MVAAVSMHLWNHGVVGGAIGNAGGWRCRLHHCVTGMLETLVVGGAGCTTVLGANGMSTRSDLERGLLSSTSLFT